MRHSLSEGVDLRLIKRELKNRFLRRFDVDTLAALIAESLKKMKPVLPLPEMLAIKIARHLLAKPLFKQRDLESLIENRPVEFACAVEASDWDELQLIADWVNKISAKNHGLCG